MTLVLCVDLHEIDPNDDRRVYGSGRVGSVRIEEIGVHEDGTADYVIKFAVDRISGMGYHRRSILRFPKNQFNSLGLLRQALMTLEEEELRHDGKTLS